jgi:arsenical pump membrane protein
VLVRPRGVSEWVWAVSGAAILVLCGSISVADVVRAVGKGTDVYLFLAGMMVLAEIARREGVFEWMASLTVVAARGSRFRLFALIYAVGIAVTVVLSNDATAVVLTPAVAAAVRKARAEPLPYLYACAFVANAASFVLPISNPANLVIFAASMPPLGGWLAAFALPSLLAIATTFAALAIVSRRDFHGEAESDRNVPSLSASGRVALGGIGLTALALILGSARGAPLGAVTAASGSLVFAIVALRDRPAFGEVFASVSWGVLALVAGLFVLVEGLDTTGLLGLARRAAETAATWATPYGDLAGAATAAIASNLTNNLPSGLVAGASVAHLHDRAAFRSAVAIGIDLGPNLSVTGSLATILWLVALRREKIAVSAWSFLRVGAIVMPPALVLAVLAIRR